MRFCLTFQFWLVWFHRKYIKVLPDFYENGENEAPERAEMMNLMCFYSV